VLGTQQRDAERDPGALEDERSMSWIGSTSRVIATRMAAAPTSGSTRAAECVAERGRRVASEAPRVFDPRPVSRRLPPRKIGIVRENRDEGVLVGEQDYRQGNRDRIEELRQEFQQRQEAVEAVMEEMRQDVEKRAKEHPYARVSETASLALLIADAIRQSGREIALAIRETAQMREG
jgi:PHD/YefM family antitoxin component YafN of YafNO toxin-antitoxin module